MEMLIAVLVIVGALMIGVMSPGPSFVLVGRMAMGTSRKDAVAASVGMGLGGVLFAVLVLMGLKQILSSVPLLYSTLKVFGGLYLIYIAVTVWRGAKSGLDQVTANNGLSSNIPKSFLLGLTTQISNPKTAITYASIFAAMLPSVIPPVLYLVLPVAIFVVEAGWYTLVALMLSSSAPRTVYSRMKSKIDRVAGAVMAGLGLKLIASAASD